jgi:hypothetical protein
MRIIDELRIDQVREFVGPAMNLDDVRAFYLSEVRSAAPLVDAEERFQRVERAAVDVEGVRQQLSGR